MQFSVVYGGSFDPFGRHHGAAVGWLLAQPDVDQVIVVPSYAHPEKDNAGMAPFEDRHAMARLALEFEDRAHVSSVEREMAAKGDVAYSYDVLKELELLYPHATLRMGVGPDLLDLENTWEKGVELMAEYGVYRIAHMGPLRATAIRAAARARTETWTSMGAFEVARHIQAHCLYR